MIVFAVIIAALVVVLNLSVSVETKLSDNKFFLRIKLWRVTLFRWPIAVKKPEKENKSNQKEKTKRDHKNEKEQTELTADDISFYLSAFRDILRDFSKLLRYSKRKVVCDRLVFQLAFGRMDAAEVGILYGVIWAGIGNLIPLLQNVVTLKQHHISVIPVYNQNCLEIQYVGHFHMKIHHIVVIGIKMLSLFFRYLMRYTKNKKQKNKKEGGV